MTRCLPQEILAEVFTIVLYARSHIDQDTLRPIPMEAAILHLFRDFYSLQSVCRAWRNAIFSRGTFWYFAPIYCTEVPALECVQSPKLSLERSNGDLYLAAVIGQNEPGLLYITPASPRFRKVNLIAGSRMASRVLIERLLDSGPPFILSELSLYERVSSDVSSEEDIPHVLSHTSSQWDLFCKLIKSLSVFRVRNVHFDWKYMLFSSHLLELRLQDVMMGSDREDFVEFLRVLALAPQLRDLKIISVQSIFDHLSLTIISPSSRIHFPGLKSLYLEDLAHHTLVTVTDYIAPGSHRLTLYLTEQSAILDSALPADDETRLNSLRIQLEEVWVDTLVLSQDSDDWLSSSELNDILHWVPELKSLKLNGRTMDEDEFQAIIGTHVMGSESVDNAFPQLEYLDLSRVWIEDEEWLKEVILSHPIQIMALGGYILNTALESPDYEPLQINTPIVNWLRANVPDFTLTHERAQPLEYSSSVWQLW
ncbi:F-box-like protein, partial [Rhizoctonia solani AG-3 Rhs1AP]